MYIRIISLEVQARQGKASHEGLLNSFIRKFLVSIKRRVKRKV